MAAKKRLAYRGRPRRAERILSDQLLTGLSFGFQQLLEFANFRRAEDRPWTDLWGDRIRWYTYHGQPLHREPWQTSYLDDLQHSVRSDLDGVIAGTFYQPRVELRTIWSCDRDGHVVVEAPSTDLAELLTWALLEFVRQGFRPLLKRCVVCESFMAPRDKRRTFCYPPAKCENEWSNARRSLRRAQTRVRVVRHRDRHRKQARKAAEIEKVKTLIALMQKRGDTASAYALVARLERLLGTKSRRQRRRK